MFFLQMFAWLLPSCHLGFHLNTTSWPLSQKLPTDTLHNRLLYYFYRMYYSLKLHCLFLYDSFLWLMLIKL
jgi:hypothetical protein